MKYETIQDAIASIESRRRVRKDLPAFQRFVYESCPQIAQLKIIHVAGTNGRTARGYPDFSGAHLTSGPHPHR